MHKVLQIYPSIVFIHHSFTKHIKIDQYFICQKVKKKETKSQFVDQVDDHLDVEGQAVHSPRPGITFFGRAENYIWNWT